MKLNLGGGHKRFPGFLNVDVDESTNPDIIADISHLPSVKNGSVEEVICYHAIEHIQRWEVEATLVEWYRILQPGGTVAIECPDLEKCVKNFFTSRDKENLWLWGLYGDPKYKTPHMVHKWCYRVDELILLLRSCGFEDVRSERPLTHRADRDLRVVARKPG